MQHTCCRVCQFWAVSFLVLRRLHSAVAAPGGIIGYAGFSAAGGVYAVPLHARKVAGSCSSPRCPLFTPHEQGTAMRFASSSFSSLWTAVCVGSP